NATYSVCPLGSNDWQLKADNINLNTGTNRGVAENVTLEIFGMPVFYSPRYEWVLEGRESGFLSPSFGTYNEKADGKNGYRVRIPYYFNIAPDRDLLLTINHLSTRGSVAEVLYRQLISQSDLWQGGRFEIAGEYLEEDDITKNKRWLIDSKLDLSINAEIDLGLKVNRASDEDYFEDIAHKNTSESSLRSEIDITYKDDENLTLAVFAESEQLINRGVAAYTRAPELLISKSVKGLGGRSTELSLVSSNFKHAGTQTTGIRTHLQANFKRKISTKGYSISPSLNLSHANYSLDNTADKNRTIGTFNIDSKLFLEREISLFETNLVQTLTPRLAYRYTPKLDQSGLPSFDSVAKIDTYEGLFSGQKFTGLDRISNANDFTFGLESEFIDADSGDTYLSFKAAQTFFLDSQQLDFDGFLVEQRKYSDIATTLDFELGNFTFNNALQFNPENGELSEQDSAITYNLSPRKFLTLAYHDDDGIESAEAYGAYPITQNIHIFGGVNRSINDSITNKETTGIAYESCCWALRLAHFKEHIDSDNFDRTTSIELVFKGLGSTSPDLARRLEASIPNYLANLDD
ncbi:MAG: LPS-assembly protein LptD, partial [Candidatus Thioglobus sp.]|nr:LPS-assembly protein LptD [Candidatus Thioglobus sp.]